MKHILIYTILIFALANSVTLNAQEKKRCGADDVYNSLTEKKKKISLRYRQIFEREIYTKVNEIHLKRKSNYDEIIKDSLLLNEYYVKSEEQFISGVKNHIDIEFGLYQNAIITQINSIEYSNNSNLYDKKLETFLNDIIQNNHLIIEIYIAISRTKNSIQKDKLSDEMMILERIKTLILNKYPGLKSRITLLPFRYLTNKHHVYNDKIDIIIIHTK